VAKDSCIQTVSELGRLGLGLDRGPFAQFFAFVLLLPFLRNGRLKSRAQTLLIPLLTSSQTALRICGLWLAIREGAMSRKR
jgi:hypothetical protein